MNSLRVLLAPSAYYPHVGGIEELTRQLVLALRANGHEAAVLTNRWPEGTAKRELLDGVDVSRLAFPLPANRPLAAAGFLAAGLPAVTTLVRHVRRWRPDVVHVIGAGPPAIYLAALRGRLGTRLVFTAQGELTFDASNIFDRSPVFRAGLRRMLRVADAVTACSAFVLRDIEAFGEIRSPSQVVPNGVDPGEFAAGPAEAALGTYVLGTGRLVPQKGFDVLLDAFAASSLDRLVLVLAGDGFARPELERQAAALDLTPRVHFAGAVGRERLGELLRGARAFAFPSRDEPFGIALLEAMAAGVPAVAAASGGVLEFARDGENALLTTPEDPAALAAGIARVTADDELRDRLVTGGRATAADLSWSRIVERYEGIYQAVIAGGSA